MKRGTLSGGASEAKQSERVACSAQLAALGLPGEVRRRPRAGRATSRLLVMWRLLRVRVPRHVRVIHILIYGKYSASMNGPGDRDTSCLSHFSLVLRHMM